MMLGRENYDGVTQDSSQRLLEEKATALALRSEQVRRVRFLWLMAEMPLAARGESLVYSLLEATLANK